jgi:hypothetical protein
MSAKYFSLGCAALAFIFIFVGCNMSVWQFADIRLYAWVIGLILAVGLAFITNAAVRRLYRSAEQRDKAQRRAWAEAFLKPLLPSDEKLLAFTNGSQGPRVWYYVALTPRGLLLAEVSGQQLVGLPEFVPLSDVKRLAYSFHWGYFLSGLGYLLLGLLSIGSAPYGLNSHVNYTPRNYRLRLELTHRTIDLMIPIVMEDEARALAAVWKGTA